jgi:hypothetical protein
MRNGRKRKRKSIERHPEVIATSSPQQDEPGNIMQVWCLLGIKSAGAASTSLKARYSTLASVELYFNCKTLFNAYTKYMESFDRRNKRRGTRATPKSGMALVPVKISDQGTTLFTGDQLYLPGNNFIYLLQQLIGK